MEVGTHDAFERRYMEKFRAIAAEYGEFVKYERDRATRDIGLHLTRPTSKGKELVSPALVWFQMKGIHSSTLSLKEYDKAKNVALSLDMKHLKFWYMLPEPTYLVIYVESADVFHVCDIQKLVAEKHGDTILSEESKSLTVRVPKEFILDETAFRQMLIEAEASAWAARFKMKRAHWELLAVHYHLIYRLQTRKERSVYGRFVIWDWLTKTRLEYHYLESPRNDTDNWQIVWNQWEYMGFVESLERRFPYLTFKPTDESGEDPDEWADPFDEALAGMFLGETHSITLPSGERVYGRAEMGERVEYKCRVKLNSLGRKLAKYLKLLIDTGFIEVDLTQAHWLSLAGFHNRGI